MARNARVIPGTVEYIRPVYEYLDTGHALCYLCDSLHVLTGIYYTRCYFSILLLQHPAIHN